MSSSQTIHKVALIGGTGSVGSHILRSLLAYNKHEITVLTRTTSTETFPSQVTVKKVDYTSDDSIISALRGQEFLIITLSAAAPADTHSRIVNAAAAAGVQYILPNHFGYALKDDKRSKAPMDPLIYFERYVDDVRAVASQGVDFVTIACGFWYEWSLGMAPEFFGFDIPNRKVTFYNDGKTRINTSTWKQCGEAIAKILSGNVEQYANKAVYISSFLISQRDMLDSLHRVLGTSDQDWDIEYQNVQERYEEGLAQMKAGERTGYAKLMYAKGFYPGGHGDYETGWDLDNKKLGLEKEELDEATRRTVKMVEKGFGLKTWAETGKAVRAD